MTAYLMLLSTAALAVFVVAGGLPRRMATPEPVLAELVHLDAGSYAYRPAGEFRIGTRVVDAPRLAQSAARGLDVMKYQVSEADYARCIAADACPAVETQGLATRAQTGINHADATAYAAWFSDLTGQHWRLPTDAEWLRAAGDRAEDDGLEADASGADPSRRWLAAYRREAAVRGAADFTAHARGSFGLNDLGVADIAGNVWEWTETCFQNGTLSVDGQTITTVSDYCGVRAVQGKHRAFVTDFIRDARSGGCSAGVPPDFLGFRLVRDPD